MNTAKIYQDSEGKDCTIHQMVEREPRWAASRIQEGEKAIDRARIAERREEELAEFAERLLSFANEQAAGNDPTGGLDPSCRPEIIDEGRDLLAKHKGGELGEPE